MLQQAPKLLFSRIALQHAAAASCTCLQQQQGSLLHAPQQQQQQSYAGWSTHQQARWQSSSSNTSAADAVQHSSSSGWSWFGSSSTAQQPAATAAAAAAAAGGNADPAATAAAAADPAVLAAAAAPAAAAPSDAVELISQADVLVDASSAAADAILAAAQASCWWNTRLFIDLLMWSHSGGFPWFEAIMVSNVVIKLAALPLTIFTQKMAPTMAAMRVDTQGLKDIAGKMGKAATASQYAEYAQEFQKAQNEFNMKYHGKKRYGFITPVGIILQMVVFISQFNAISTLANAKLPSMTYEGALWFTDLTIPDPIMVLPLLCAGMTAVQANSKRFQDVMMSQNPQAAPMRALMTAMGGVILVAGYFTPSAMALLWATNSAISIAQSALLGSPVARKALGLPAMPKAPPPGSSSSSSAGGFLAQLTGRAAPEQQPKPVPAAAVGAPPPGTIAVNYTTSKPSRRRGKV